MHFISYFFLSVAEVLNVLLTLFMWVIVARALFSWINPDPFNPIVRFIQNITEPAIRSLRSKLPTVYGGMDFSSIIIFLCVMFLRTFAVNSLKEISRLLL